MTNQTTSHPVFLDCDTGIDDALALAYLLAEPTVDLVGIATVSGNVNAAQGARNTIDLLNLAGRDDIPVAVGESHPLAGEYTGAVPHIHGTNGIGDVLLERSARNPVDVAGPQLLIELAHQFPGRLRLIAIGPLTNIATALMAAPDLLDLVHSVTIMGGAINVPGNVTPYAEANIWNDPEAAHIVLTADWPITLVPLDVTMQQLLTEADRLQLVTAPFDLPRALGRILDLYFDFYADRLGTRLCALHDPLAAVIAAEAITTSGELSPPSLDVELAGEERGRTVIAKHRRTTPIRVVLNTAAPLAPQLMHALLEQPGGSTSTI